MKRNKKLRIAAVAAAVLAAGVMTVYAAYDSSRDPLVSLSYLNEVFKPEVKAELKTELYNQLAEDYSATIDALQKQIDVLSNEYDVVNMTNGQRLTADASCEIVLLSGNASVRCSAASEGIIDCTDGFILYEGQMVEENHKLLVPDNGDGRGLTALSDAKLLVKGGYTLG